jgi:hypothetical protein
LRSGAGPRSKQLKKHTQLDLDDATFQQYWETDRLANNLPPRGSHKGAVTALSLYSDTAQGQNLDAVADRWLDSTFVDQLFPK